MVRFTTPFFTSVRGLLSLYFLLFFGWRFSSLMFSSRRHYFEHVKRDVLGALVEDSSCFALGGYSPKRANKKDVFVLHAAPRLVVARAFFSSHSFSYSFYLAYSFFLSLLSGNGTHSSCRRWRARAAHDTAAIGNHHTVLQCQRDWLMERLSSAGGHV